MGIEEICDGIEALPAGDLDKVIDFALGVRRLREQGRDDDARADADLDAIAADPERLAKFRAAIDVGWQQSQRGEGRPADEVFADIRRRKQERPLGVKGA